MALARPLVYSDSRAVQVRPTHCPAELGRWDLLIARQLRICSRGLFGRGLRYVATLGSKWIALQGWRAGALTSVSLRRPSRRERIPKRERCASVCISLEPTKAFATGSRAMWGCTRVSQLVRSGRPATHDPTMELNSWLGRTHFVFALGDHHQSRQDEENEQS